MTKLHKCLKDLSGKLVCITGGDSVSLISVSEESFPDRTVLHFPEWSKTLEEQVRLVSVLHKTKNTGLIVIITQSPWIISDIPRDQVLVIGKRKKIEYPDFETFGASVNKITMSILERRETFGDYAKATLEAFRKRLDKMEHGKVPPEFFHEVARAMGDSIEKTLFLNCVMHKEGKFDKKDKP
jgi:hypothetical protein